MKKWLVIILIVIFSIIFLVSLGYLLDYFKKSTENTVLYEDLAQIVDQARQTIPTEPNTDPATDSTDPTAETAPKYTYVQIQDPETGETIDILPEYAPVYQLNNDLVGWISIDGTSVNYPVMQTPDRSNYYLERNFEEKYSAHGAIYVQENCDVFAPSDNLVLYGHRMVDGSMFASLHNYKDKAFYDQHSFIRFDTLKERHNYQILCVFKISSVANSPFQYHHFVDFQNESQFETFMSHCDTYQLYDTGVEVQWGDKLITLSTCDRSISNGRLVVVAKQID